MHVNFHFIHQDEHRWKNKTESTIVHHKNSNILFQPQACPIVLTWSAHLVHCASSSSRSHANTDTSFALLLLGILVTHPAHDGYVFFYILCNHKTQQRSTLILIAFSFSKTLGLGQIPSWSRIFFLLTRIHNISLSQQQIFPLLIHGSLHHPIILTKPQGVALE